MAKGGVLRKHSIGAARALLAAALVALALAYPVTTRVARGAAGRAAVVTGALSSRPAADNGCPVGTTPPPGRATCVEGIPHFSHVITGVLENKSRDQIWYPGYISATDTITPGTPPMDTMPITSNTPNPYLNALVPTGAFMQDYYGAGHFSFDNYLALTLGQTPNPTTQDDCPNFYSCVQAEMNPAYTPGSGASPGGGVSVADQLERNGYTWKGYLDAMPTPCTHASLSPADPATYGQDPYVGGNALGDYADRHDPFVYLPPIVNNQSRCAAHVVPYTDTVTGLMADIQRDTVPDYTFITPDTCNDGHDVPFCGPVKRNKLGGLVAVDQWLQSNIQPIIDYVNKHNGVLFVVWDESDIRTKTGDPFPNNDFGPIPVTSTIAPVDLAGCCAGTPRQGDAGGLIGALAISPLIKPGLVSRVPHDHASLLRTIEDSFGFQDAAGAPQYLGDAGSPLEQGHAMTELFTSTVSVASPTAGLPTTPALLPSSSPTTAASPTGTARAVSSATATLQATGIAGASPSPGATPVAGASPSPGATQAVVTVMGMATTTPTIPPPLPATMTPGAGATTAPVATAPPATAAPTGASPAQASVSPPSAATTIAIAPAGAATPTPPPTTTSTRGAAPVDTPTPGAPPAPATPRAGAPTPVVGPIIALRPGVVRPGGVVTVRGRGFGSREMVTLALDGAARSTAPPAIVTGADGTFTATFAAPDTLLQEANSVSAVGAHTRRAALARLDGILSVAARYYIAGGLSTATDSSTVTLLNPNRAAASVRLMFYYADGATATRSVVVGPNGRRGVAVPAGAGRGRGRPFGLYIAATRPVAAQVDMARRGKDGDTLLGATGLGRRWYLAEGYTGLSFHEQISILNPDARGAARVRLTLLPADGRAARTVAVTVPAHTNDVVDVNRLLPGRALGVLATSDRPVAVERTLTFGKDGYGLTARVGVGAAATSWIFAEGTTTSGFQTYLTLFNPGDRAAQATVSLFGRGGPTLRRTTVSVAAHGRATLALNRLVHASGFASVVTSDRPIVVERPEYFGSPNGRRVAGSDVFGRNGTGAAWSFPGPGAGGPSTEVAGESRFLLLYNPSPFTLLVDVTLYDGGGRALTRRVNVPPTARATLDLRRLVPGFVASGGIVARSVDGRGFVAEQTTFMSDHSALSSTEGIAR